MNRIDALPRRIRLLGNQQFKRVDGHRKVPGELLNHLQVTLGERIHVGTFDVKRTDHIIMQNERHRQRTFRANQAVKIKRILGCIFAQIAFTSRRDKPGHAIAMYHMEECEPIHKVTIIPRGKALGATMQLPKKDRYTQSQKRLEADLVAFMGGRAAEELIFGDITTGAHNDIERSTAIARAMVCEYGMSKKVGPQNLSSNREPIFMGQGMTGAQEHSEKTANLIDEEVQRILNEAYETCMNLLVEHKESLVNLSEILIEKEVLDAEEVISILETGQLPEKPAAPEVEPEEPIDPEEPIEPEAEERIDSENPEESTSD